MLGISGLLPAGFAEPAPGPAPFDEAIRFFRQKLNLPTKTWRDLWQGEHARAFVVAGATKDALLADMRQALQQALDKGTTFQDWQKDFGKIIDAHGWEPKGGRDWRARVIYSTNVSTAYHAGRYEQLQAVKADRPFWQYRHGGSKRPRPDHKSWDGKVLPADDPWWSTAYPPNGWGCRCYVVPLSASQMKARGLAVSEAPDAIATEAAIKPEWRYSVGEAATGRTLPAPEFAAWEAERPWRRLTPGDWQSAGRPEELPADRPAAPLGRQPTDAAAIERELVRILGGPEAVLRLPDGSPVRIVAAELAQHLAQDPGRAPFLPLLPSLIEAPFEVWSSFERHKGTGKVRLRRTAVKRVDLPRQRSFVLGLGAVAGQLEAVTFFPSGGRDINNRRVGALAWGRKVEPGES